MRNGDLELKNHIEEMLLQDPSVDAAGIGVSVADAIVVLHGRVRSFLEKQQVSELVQQIRGVRAVANELEVELPADTKRSDEQIAHTIASVFAWDVRVPENQIHVQVSDGWVTLQGHVRWHFQKREAENIVARLMGVQGVTNQIEVEKPMHEATTKKEVNSTLYMRGCNDNVEVTVEGNRVTIRGTVRSLADRQAIEFAIWAIPGVRAIDNLLEVQSILQRELQTAV